MAFREGPFQDLKVPLTWTGAAAAVLAIVVARACALVIAAHTYHNSPCSSRCADRGDDDEQGHRAADREVL